jgi:Ca-activated chloride channel homolog
VIDPDLLEHLLAGGEAGGRRITPNLLLLVGWVLCVLAVAGPVWEREPSPFADAKPPVMVVLRVAPSMQTPDLSPTRLDRARQKLADLFKLREGAATGLIAYAGSAHLVLPPTSDGDVVLAMAGALSPEIMPKEGDDLVSAMALARRVLAGNGAGGSVLLVADTVASDQVGRLQPGSVPTTLFAAAPPEVAAADQGLEGADSALDARLVATTVDQSDVTEIAARLDRVGQPRDVAGEGEHWKEAGYWLTPLIALIALGWFRRGWVLA